MQEDDKNQNQPTVQQPVGHEHVPGEAITVEAPKKDPPAIYTIRTTVGRENVVIEAVSSKAKALGFDLKAFIHPEQLKGYVFVEGVLSDIQNAVQNTPHIRGVIAKAVPLAQLERFLEEGRTKIEIHLDDIVEIVGGPFKGEKGKVLRTNEAKDEVTVELVEATVPIPVTVSTESIRILESKQKKGEQK
jgi:transcription termination/antitermination protein NusG